MEPKPIRTDNQDFRGNYAAAQDHVLPADSAQRGLRKTYLLLALTMVPTVIGAAIGIQLAPAMMASPVISVVLMLASVIGLQFGIAHYRNSGIGVALLLLMTGLMGLFLGPLLIAALANMFFQIPALALTISTLVIVVFSLFLLYDLNRIVRGGETNYVMATTGVYLSLLKSLLALSGDRD